MRARQRHLNPKTAGATMVLDSRYVSGLSDADPVSTWTDRSGNGYSPTQATAVNKPTFKISQQGGNPTIRFDGGDSLYYAANVAPNVGITMMAVCKFDSLSTRSALADIKNAGSGFNGFLIEANVFGSAGNRLGLYASSSAIDASFATTTNPVLVSVAADTTSGGTIVSNTDYFRDGVGGSLAVKAGLTTYNDLTGLSGVMIGSYNVSGSPNYAYFDGDFYSMTVLPSKASTSLRRRLEHAAAFAFKLPCS